MENIESTNTNEGSVSNVLIDLKEAQTAQIMGIISLVLVFCTCCYGGLIGAILGYLAMKKGKEAIAEYEANPGMYTEKSFNQAKTGKTTGLIGVIVGILALLYIVFSLVFGFASAISDMGRGAF